MMWIDYWPLIVAAIAALVVAGVGCYKFLGAPTAQQLKAVSSWLLYACTKAEEALGDGTGRLKLPMVYDMFVERFPALVRVVPFELFSTLVDTALVEMRNLIATNPNVTALVNKEANYNGNG